MIAHLELVPAPTAFEEFSSPGSNATVLPANSDIITPPPGPLTTLKDEVIDS